MIVSAIENFSKYVRARWAQNQWDKAQLWPHLLGRNDPSVQFLKWGELGKKWEIAFWKKWELRVHSSQTFSLHFFSFFFFPPKQNSAV